VRTAELGDRHVGGRAARGVDVDRRAAVHRRVDLLLPELLARDGIEPVYRPAVVAGDQHAVGDDRRPREVRRSGT